jgi:hypothetical protein
MQGLKSAVILAAVVGTALTLGACRREVPAEPMKLGATAPAVQAVR